MGSQVHMGEVHPHEERSARLVHPFDEIGRARGDVVVDRFHPRAGQRAGILDLLLADASPARLVLAVVHIGRETVDHTARAKTLCEVGNVGRFWIVGLLRVFLRIQMIEIAIKLVEAMNGRQELIAVTEMVLAELPGGVTKWLQHARYRRIGRVEPDRRAGHPDLRKSRAKHALPRDEGRSASRAALFAIVIGEQHALASDAINVWRAIAHHAHRIA